MTGCGVLVRSRLGILVYHKFHCADKPEITGTIIDHYTIRNAWAGIRGRGTGAIGLKH
jgi:hypothetical protein